MKKCHYCNKPTTENKEWQKKKRERKKEKTYADVVSSGLGFSTEEVAFKTSTPNIITSLHQHFHL